MGLFALELGTARVSVRESNRAQFHDALPASDKDDYDAVLLDRAIEQLRNTSSGHSIADYLDEHRDRIKIVDAGGIPNAPAGAGGAWVNINRTLYIERSQLEDPAGATLLAHEGVHMRDDGNAALMFGKRMLSVVRGAAQLVIAPLTGRNPITASFDDVYGAVAYDHEVRAYAAQARIAGEMGASIYGGSLQNADGSAKSDDEIEQLIRASPLYTARLELRALVGAGMAFLGARAGADIVTRIAKRAAPTSLLARTSMPATLVLGTALAGALALDLYHHRDAPRMFGDE